ncbi:hypothetical protein VCR15J2_20580 [Vibrio coralliirubri]|nr:hypothetical protein VCR15J2_20580 [Vibrio coralliirubri]CDT75904.1 hypothetical protein VCR8J2_190396 [Vibrio coralliirubri]
MKRLTVNTSKVAKAVSALAQLACEQTKGLKVSFINKLLTNRLSQAN